MMERKEKFYYCKNKLRNFYSLVRLYLLGGSPISKRLSRHAILERAPVLGAGKIALAFAHRFARFEYRLQNIIEHGFFTGSNFDTSGHAGNDRQFFAIVRQR
jgi:hypothetical protein